MKILGLPARVGRGRLALAAIVVGVLAVGGGVTRSVTAATTSITITSSQQPAAAATATVSSTGQTTYVFYSLTLVSNSSWTHVTLTDKQPSVSLNGTAALLNDASVVFVGGCPSTPALLANGGFSCGIDKLSPSVPLTISVVVQTPTSGDTLAVQPVVTGDERASDQNSAKPDTFQTPLSWTLSSDTTNAVTSYTNPAASSGTAAFFTNKQLTPQNPQWTQADVPNGLAPLGVLVSLQERPFGAGECPSIVTSSGGTCFGQVSQIGVGSSGSGGVFTSTPLGFTVRVAAASLTSKVNPAKSYLLHNPGTGYEKVPLCSTGRTDSTGDCTDSIILDPVTHDVIWKAHGPSNGTWGGAH
jgi:hypothetical protein